MPRYFNRVINFSVRGEIYDIKDTSPESIIKNYNFSFQDNEDGSFTITGRHKDNRGRITKMVKLPRIYRSKKPDTGYYVNM